MSRYGLPDQQALRFCGLLIADRSQAARIQRFAMTVHRSEWNCDCDQGPGSSLALCALHQPGLGRHRMRQAALRAGRLVSPACKRQMIRIAQRHPIR
jgi:hypothetical protein